MANELVTMSGASAETAKVTVASEVIVPHRIKFLSRAGREMLTICEDGRFLVNGKVVEVDKEVYDAFCDWLSTTTGKSVGSGLLLTDEPQRNEKGQVICPAK